MLDIKIQLNIQHVCSQHKDTQIIYALVNYFSGTNKKIHMHTA